jgi:hypothetical protein
MTAKFDARSVDLNSGTSLAPVVAVQCKTRIAIFYNGGNGVGDGRREDGQAKVEVPPSSPPLLAATVPVTLCARFRPGQNPAPVQKLRV